jgi:hypothetical protein
MLRELILEGQGSRTDAFWGVPVAGLEGHVSRSAVCLVHKAFNLKGLDREVSDRRLAEEARLHPQSVFLRNSDAITRGV